jgi:hypothetical protein
MIFADEYECAEPHFQDSTLTLRKARKHDDPRAYLLIEPQAHFTPVFQPVLQRPEGIIIVQPVAFEFSTLQELDFMTLCELLFQEEENEFVCPDSLAGCLVSFSQRGYIRNCNRWDILKDIRVEWSKENVAFGK